MRNTCPLAVSRPRIAEGSRPTTRFSVAALAEGCWKLTCPVGAIEKLCQLIAARCEPWMMSSRLAVVC